VIGKGRKERMLPIGANAALAMGRYLRMRVHTATLRCRRSGSGSAVR